mgnify:CR=1 FL=1
MSHGIKGETSAQGTPKGTTICGIVGVVFGALGLVLSFIPIVNNIAAILGASAWCWRSSPWWGRSAARRRARYFPSSRRCCRCSPSSSLCHAVRSQQGH